MLSPKSFLTFGLLALSSLITPASAVYKITKRDEPLALVNLRVEGATKTLFEGDILVAYGNVTTASGGNHKCNGQNGGTNPQKGPTPTYALKDAPLSFDGTYDSSFQDFFITRIGTDAETATQFWGLLVNFQFTPVGGCQQEISTGQQVLWVYDAFNYNAFLKLSGPVTAARNHPVTFTVTDGSTGAPVAGASVWGATSGADGKVSVVFGSVGVQQVKATKSGAARSNAVGVVVF